MLVYQMPRPYVTLNGVDLKACSQGLASDMTLEEVIASLEETLPGSGAFVTDQPACFFMDNFDTGTQFSDTYLEIWVPDTFDATSAGIITIDDHTVLEYPALEGPEPVQPTVVTNNNTVLTGTPTIAKLPTFSGVATPGALVLVTVRSDPVTCSTTADTQGNWACTLPGALPAGAHSVTVDVTDPGAAEPRTLGPYPVVVAASTEIPGQVGGGDSEAPASSVIRGTSSSSQRAAAGQIARNDAAPADSLAQADTTPGSTDEEPVTTQRETDQADVELVGSPAATDWSWLWWALGGLVAVVLIVLLAARRQKEQ